MEAALGAPAVALRHALQLVLMAGTALVVLHQHRPVLSARIGWLAFCTRVMARCREAIVPVNALRAGRDAVVGSRVVPVAPG